MRLSNGLELTAEQESNLRKLAYFHLRGIEASPMGFDMEFFIDTGEDQVEWVFPCNSTNVCGTVGCLVGHGPHAGIKGLDGEDWDAYSFRAFIPAAADDEWEWCFSDEWSRVDNTPAGGAKRILWLLERSLPANWIDQLSGEAPLCYADWTPELPPEIEEQVPTRTAVGV